MKRYPKGTLDFNKVSNYRGLTLMIVPNISYIFQLVIFSNNLIYLGMFKQCLNTWSLNDNVIWIMGLGFNLSVTWGLYNDTIVKLMDTL